MATRGQAFLFGCGFLLVSGLFALAVGFLLWKAGDGSLASLGRDKVGLVVIEGPIVDSRYWVDEIEANLRDPSIGAVVGAPAAVGVPAAVSQPGRVAPPRRSELRSAEQARTLRRVGSPAASVHRADSTPREASRADRRAARAAAVPGMPGSRPGADRGGYRTGGRAVPRALPRH